MELLIGVVVGFGLGYGVRSAMLRYRRAHARRERGFRGLWISKKWGVPGKGVAGQEATLPSMIAAVRGPLACGEVFPDGASM